MEMLHRLLLCTFILQPGVVCGESCGRENVTGAVGGSVILPVHHRKIEFINWVLLPEGIVFVPTEPGKSIDNRKVKTQYKGRVRSEDDGSLHIYNLSLEDQRTYKADVQTAEGDICVLYNLNVYERLSPRDIKITHSFTRNDTCSLSLLCTANRRYVMITWSHLYGSEINVTQGVLYVPPSGVNLTYICTARNPVSNVSKTVIPGEYCKTEPSLMRRKDLLGTLRWVLSGVVLLITSCILIYHIKTEVIQPSSGP